MTKNVFAYLMMGGGVFFLIYVVKSEGADGDGRRTFQTVEMGRVSNKKQAGDDGRHLSALDPTCLFNKQLLLKLHALLEAGPLFTLDDTQPP